MSTPLSNQNRKQSITRGKKVKNRRDATPERDEPDDKTEDDKSHFSKRSRKIHNLKPVEENYPNEAFDKYPDDASSCLSFIDEK